VIRNTLFILLLASIISCQERNQQSINQIAEQKEVSVNDELAPIMLDDIHYYTQNRKSCNDFFEINFGTRAVLEESPNPFEFIDFQLLQPGQSTINISKRGPFPGIAVGDPKRWERNFELPSPGNPPRYGVHWLALSTPILDQTIQKLEKNHVSIIDKNFSLPHSNATSILCTGPDYNLIVVKEDLDNEDVDGYSVDHLMLLVEDLEENQKFFTEVFRGQLIDTKKHYAHMMVGNHQIVLAEPEALNIDRSTVKRRDPKTYRPDIDHLGFLYKNMQPAYDNAIALGYKFLGPPNKIQYYEKPTLYTFAITFSPDGLQCEMYQEEGRTSSRTQFKS